MKKETKEQADEINIILSQILKSGFKLSKNRVLDGHSASKWIEIYNNGKWECYYK